MICEGILFFIGLSMVLSGRVQLGQRILVGQRVRMAGWVLMTPTIIIFAVDMFTTPPYISDSATLDEIVKASMSFFFFELVVLVGALGLASWLVNTKPGQQTVSQQMEPPVIEPVFGKILTLREAALYLRVTEADILELINTNRLAAARFGGEYRIARIALDDYRAGLAGEGSS